MQMRMVQNLIPWALLTAIIWVAISQQDLRSQSNNPNNGRIRAAQDFERRGNYPSALRIYRSLYDMVPKNQLYYEGVKRNMLRLKKYDELLAIVQQQISRSNDVRFQADLGNVYYKRGDQLQGLEIWSSLLENYPRNRSVYPYVANAMVDNRLYDEATEVYLGARKKLQQDLIFVFELANIYVLRLNYKEASLEYLRYLEKNPQQFGYIEGRIASYTNETENAAEVAEILRANLAGHKQKYLVRKLLADLYLRIEEYAESLQEFRILESEQRPVTVQGKESGREVYFFAEKALKAGEFEYAQQAFDLILSKYADSPLRPRALYGVAQAKQEQQAFDEALGSYEQLIAVAPKSPWAQEALFQIGEIYFDNFFDLDKALGAYTSLLTKYPNGKKSLDASFRIGDCHAARGELKQAQAWYEKHVNAVNPRIQAGDRSLYNSAYIDFLSANFDDALKKLNKITENAGRPNNDQTFVNDALELIMLIEENRNGAPEALGDYVEAQSWKIQRKVAEAINTLQSVLLTYPTASIIDDTVFDLGELENTRGNYHASIDYFRSLLAEQPESVYAALAQKRVGEVYEYGLGDFEKAYESYELVLIDHPQSVYLEEVRQKMRELQSRQPSN